MKKLLHRIVSIVLLFVFLLTVNGILIFNHTCLSCHSEDTSLFVETHHEHCCSVKEENHESDCCHDANCAIENFPVNAEENCCKENVELVRISIPFTGLNFDFSKIFDFQTVYKNISFFYIPKSIVFFSSCYHNHFISLEKMVLFCNFRL